MIPEYFEVFTLRNSFYSAVKKKKAASWPLYLFLLLKGVRCFTLGTFARLATSLFGFSAFLAFEYCH
jgi:hypothetical protein